VVVADLSWDRSNPAVTTVRLVVSVSYEVCINKIILCDASCSCIVDRYLIIHGGEGARAEEVEEEDLIANALNLKREPSSSAIKSIEVVTQSSSILSELSQTNALSGLLLQTNNDATKSWCTVQVGICPGDSLGGRLRSVVMQVDSRGLNTAPNTAPNTPSSRGMHV
jgi:hypothetical protein